MKQSKRDAFVGEEAAAPAGPWKKRVGIIGMAAAALAVVLFIVFSDAPAPLTAVAAEPSGIVRIPLQDVNDGAAHFFAYRGIEFFVLRSSDGAIRAAFNACDVCYGAKKGYKQKGDSMVCKNCGQSFPSTRINDVTGGCNPAPLERHLDGCCVIFKVSDIEQGARYFQ